MQIEDKVVVVTGASPGIGLAVAHALVRQGARGNRPRALPGGNGMLFVVQRMSPRLASRIMNGLGFKALSKVLSGELPPPQLQPPA